MSYNFTSSPLHVPSVSPVSTASYASSDASYSPPGIDELPPSPSPANRTAPLTRSLRAEKCHPLQELFMILYLGGACSEHIQQHGTVMAQCAREGRRTDAIKRAEQVGRTKLAGRVGRTKLAKQTEPTQTNRKCRKTAKVKIDRPTLKPLLRNISLNSLSPEFLAVSVAASSRKKMVDRKRLAPLGSFAKSGVEEKLIVEGLEAAQKQYKFPESSPTTSSLLGKRVRQQTEHEPSINPIGHLLSTATSTTPKTDDAAIYRCSNVPSVIHISEGSSRLAKKAKLLLNISPRMTSELSTSARWASAGFEPGCIRNRKPEHQQSVALSQRRAELVTAERHVRSIEAWAKQVKSARLCSDRPERTSSRRSTKSTVMDSPSSRPVHKSHQILPSTTRSVVSKEAKVDCSVIKLDGQDGQEFSIGFLVFVLFFTLVYLCMCLL